MHGKELIVMVKKVQVEKKFLKGSLYGAGVILAASALLCGLFALLVSTGRVGEGGEAWLTALASFLAAVAGALVARKVNKGMSLIGGVTAALLAVAVRLVLTVFSGLVPSGEMLTISACMLLGSALTGFLAAGRKRKIR